MMEGDFQQELVLKLYYSSKISNFEKYPLDPAGRSYMSFHYAC